MVKKTAISFLESYKSGEGGDAKKLVPIHYTHELPTADEERLGKIFKELDRDGNGRIDIHDLSESLKENGLCHTYAEVIVFRPRLIAATRNEHREHNLKEGFIIFCVE